MVKWEKIDGNKVEMEIEVDQAVVGEALDKAFKKVVKKISIPGFRKGKVPRGVLESRFGPEVLYEEALDFLVPGAYQDAVSESGIEPIDQPNIDLVQMEKGKPFIFKAVVEVKPEVNLGEYRGVSVNHEVKEITEDDVANKLEQIRRQHVKLNVIQEGGTVSQEDLVLLDFSGFIDNEPFKGGQAEGYSLEIGSNSFIPGFEEGLIGLKVKDEKDINLTFPEEYHEETLAGKPVTFKVKINEIKRKEYPELTDDFANEVSEFGTLQEYKDDLMKDLVKQEEQRAKSELENKVVEAVAENADSVIPDVLVEREIDRMISDMENFLRMQGLSMEYFLQIAGKSIEDVRADKRDEAKSRVKANLVLGAVVQKEGIEALDEEVEEHIESFAKGYGQDIEKIKEYFKNPDHADAVRQEIQIKKAVDFLVSEASVTTTVVERDAATENTE